MVYIEAEEIKKLPLKSDIWACQFSDQRTLKPRKGKIFSINKFSIYFVENKRPERDSEDNPEEKDFKNPCENDCEDISEKIFYTSLFYADTQKECEAIFNILIERKIKELTNKIEEYKGMKI